MSDIELKNKPLVEVYVEIRWRLIEDDGRQIDPHYKFLLGRFYDKVKNRYPAHKQLPPASVPDEMVPHTVQHQFRAEPDGWPVIQIGPGILTVNETEKYTWPYFKKLSTDAVHSFFEAYPEPDNLKITSIFLKYIDALCFDSASEHVFDYLKDKLKISVLLPDSLFEGTQVNNRPTNLNWQTSFLHMTLPGRIVLRFATGRQKREEKERPALIWETLVHSVGKDVPSMPEGFSNWLETAHDITHDWFFKLIEGDLLKEFRGE